MGRAFAVLCCLGGLAGCPLKSASTGSAAVAAAAAEVAVLPVEPALDSAASRDVADEAPGAREEASRRSAGRELGVYVPALHPMNVHRAQPGESLLLQDGAALQAAAAACRMELDFALMLTSRARQLYQRFPDGDVDVTPDASWPREYVFNTAPHSPERYPAGTYIGFGSGTAAELAPGKADEDPHFVATFRIDEAGRAQRLDSARLASFFWMKVCLLDANADGLLDVVASSSPGASGGGAVDAFTVQADGRFSRPPGPEDLWPPPDGERFDTAYSAFCLVDFDGDGCYEIETQDFVSYEGGSGSYQYTRIAAWDARTRRWDSATPRFPSAIAEQREFYTAYLAAARQAPAQQRDEYMSRALLRWRGHAYRLGEFDHADVAYLLQDWDGLAAWQAGRH